MASNSSKTARRFCYSKGLGTRICNLILSGESMTDICALNDMPSKTTFLRWLVMYPEFATQYAHAKQLAAEFMFDDMQRIADDSSGDWEERRDVHGKPYLIPCIDHILRVKQRINVRMWKLARLDPKKYGDKVSIDQKTEVVQVEPKKVLGTERMTYEEKRSFTYLLGLVTIRNEGDPIPPVPDPRPPSKSEIFKPDKLAEPPPDWEPEEEE